MASAVDYIYRERGKGMELAVENLTIESNNMRNVKSEHVFATSFI